MGIKSLKTLIGQVVTETTLETFRGKRVVIDVSLYMYRFAYWNSNPLEGFKNQIQALKAVDIDPVYVFDGEPPMVKEPVLQERRERQEKMEQKKQELETQLNGIIDELKQQDKDSIHREKKQAKAMQLRLALSNHTKNMINVTPEHFDELRRLLTEMQIEWHNAVNEADSLAAKLCCNGTVSAVMTEDMDALAFGCAQVITGFSNDKNEIKLFRLEDVLKAVECDYSRFVDLCIMCGCDYVARLYRIGPKTALKLLKKHGTIENVVSNIDREKHRVPENYLELVAEARRLFLEPTNKRMYEKKVKTNSDINNK